MSKECILSILKRLSEAKPSFEILRFDIRYSAVRCLIQPIEAASLIIKIPCHSGVVAHEYLTLPFPDTRHLTPYVS